MPTPLETAIAERDAARTERDAAVTAEGKAVARLEGQTDLATQHKAERDAAKVDLNKKIKENQAVSLNAIDIVEKAKVSQGAAQDEAKAARIEKDAAKDALVVKAEQAEELGKAVEAHETASATNADMISALQSRVRTQGAVAEKSETDAKLASTKITALEALVQAQKTELARRPAAPATP